MNKDMEQPGIAADADAATPKSAAITTVRFGEGRVAVETGHYYGRPCVFIEPVDELGPVGELAPPSDPDGCEPGTVVLLMVDGGAGLRVLRDAIDRVIARSSAEQTEASNPGMPTHE